MISNTVDEEAIRRIYREAKNFVVIGKIIGLTREKIIEIIDESTEAMIKDKPQEEQIRLLKNLSRFSALMYLEG